MIEFIHNHRKSVVGFLGVALVAMMMTGFGVDFGGGGQRQNGAIVVNKAEIPYEDYYEQRREMERRLRTLMGENYEMIAANMKIGQQVVENLISKTVIHQEARKLNMRASSSEVHDAVERSGLFPTGFDHKVYQAYLAQIGKNAVQFEEDLRSDALSNQFVSLISDAGVPSAREIQVSIELAETEYDVDYLEIDPKSTEGEIPEPNADQLNKYFEEHASDFELAPAVGYDYLLLDPKDFTDTVEVLPEDIEGYYIDHERELTEPEQAQARHIQLTFDKEANPEKMAELRERAIKIREEALAGKSFEELVAQHSDDFATRDQGGDLGWFARGKFDPMLEDAVFKMKEVGITELVEADYGFHIVRVEGYKPKRAKELDEVRDEIAARIRADEAPGYTAARAEELLEKWKPSKQTLGEFAAGEGLSASSTSTVLKENEDPADLPGLTKKVLLTPEDPRQLVDVGQKSVLVSVTKYQAPEIPTLDVVREDVVKRWKREEAAQLAKKKADGIVDTLGKIGNPNLDAAASASNLTKKSETGMKSAKPVSGPLGAPAVKEAIFSTFTTRTAPKRAIEVSGKYYIVQVTKITPPSAEVIGAKLKERRTSEESEAGKALLTSLVGALRAKADISISGDLEFEG